MRLREQWTEILKIAWPLIVANSFWNLQLTVDRIYLGSHSTEALGAAMAVMGIFWTPMALLQQTAGYVTTFVAQYFGAKEYSHIGPAVWQSIYVSLIGGVIFLGLNSISGDIFTLVGHSPSVRALEMSYFNAITYSALPTALVAAFSGFFTGLGQTKTVLWINASGLLVNIIADYLLIFGKLGFPALGVAGAGIATTLANYAAAAVGFVLVFQAKNNAFYNLWQTWHWNGSLMRRFIYFGLPSGLQWSLEGLAFTVFLAVMGRLPNGDAALASSSIAVTLLMLAILPSLGVGQAVMVLVGQHLGEKKPELARQSTWAGFQIAAFYMILMGLTFFIFPHFYIDWFKNPKNLELWSQVSTMTPYLLMFTAWFATCDSANLTFSFALKGAGDTRFVSMVALVLPWPLMVIPTLLVQEWEGAVYWSWGAASVFAAVQALVFMQRFRSGKWQSMRVI